VPRLELMPVSVASRCPFGDGVDEGLDRQLATSAELPDLTEANRAERYLGGRLAIDQVSISGTTFDRLREHSAEARIVRVGFHTATSAPLDSRGTGRG
jgi:hypothetical protein